jgi:HSP20 family protein
MAMTTVPVKHSASTPEYTPDVWRSLRGEMDRLFDRFTGGLGMLPPPSVRFDSAFNLPVPAVDITEDETSFKLSAELPGMTEKDIQVSLSGNMLTIKGEKHQEKDEKGKDYHLTERSYGEFRRSFVLPEGMSADKVTATFVNGVLTVTIPKATQQVAKKIDINPAV